MRSKPCSSQNYLCNCAWRWRLPICLHTRAPCTEPWRGWRRSQLHTGAGNSPEGCWSPYNMSRLGKGMQITVWSCRVFQEPHRNVGVDSLGVVWLRIPTQYLQRAPRIPSGIQATLHFFYWGSCPDYTPISPLCMGLKNPKKSIEPCGCRPN